MTTSLYARYEKVQALRKGIGTENPSPAVQRIMAEEAMLKQVLDWLSVSTDIRS